MNKEKIKVSVIIPAYNVEEYIEKCLLSLINQTLKEIEILVIDDGSTDSTYKIASSFTKDSRVKVVTQENKKQGAARNHGLRLSQGEYISFIDSDDWVDENFLEELYSTAKKHNSDIAVTNILKHRKYYNKYTIKYKKESSVTDLTSKINLCKDHKQRFFYVMNKLFKREMLEQNNIIFAENCYFEDVVFTTKAIYHANKVVSTPNASYHYILRESSTVNSKSTDKKRQDHIAAYEELQKFAKDKQIKLPERLNYTHSYSLSFLTTVYEGLYKKKYLLFGLIPVFIKNKK